MPKGRYKRTERHLAQSRANLPKEPPRHWEGKKLSDEHKRKLRDNHVGTTGRHLSAETKKKISERLTGKPKAVKGPLHYRWKGGVTPENARIRSSIEYRIWRKAVFERDDYTCRFCGQRGGDLEADHIKPFALFPELRFAIDNGRTLCEDCHRKTPTYGNKIFTL